MTTAVGVDGYRGGWLAAAVGASGIRWFAGPRLADLLDLLPAGAPVGVDMPIGLPDAGPRACDVAARRRLGQRASSVFPAPCRPALSAADYAEACDRSRVAGGRALSRQSWALLPRIRELDALARGADDRLVEVHPEVSFTLLAGRGLPSKHSVPGAAARLAALQRWRRDVLSALEGLPAGPRLDDALDALAVAWSAQRWRTGQALTLPEQPLRDAVGLPMRIVA